MVAPLIHPESTIPEPIRITLLVTRTLEALGITYFIGGSLASAVHGTIRSTMGADLIVDLQIDHLQELTARLEGAFFMDPPAMVNALQHNSSFNLIHKDTMFRIDIFPLGGHPFEQNQMARRVQQSVGGHPDDRAYFTTAEDIILAKLNWFRMGGEVSEQQWRDVLGVIRVQEDTLDQDYLQLWAERLALLDLLERALSDALKSA
jgi:hypothetical protein